MVKMNKMTEDNTRIGDKKVMPNYKGAPFTATVSDSLPKGEKLAVNIFSFPFVSIILYLIIINFFFTQRQVHFVEGEVYRVEYPANTCLTPGLVVQNAQKGIGVEDYSLLYGNCEHFAVHCKTGEWESQQVKVTYES